MTEEFFWPANVSRASVPEGWTVDSAIVRVKRNVGLVKPKLQDIIMDFWFAHEEIVKGRAPGWTWTKFCEEAGVARTTPIRWFEKYNLPYASREIHKHTADANASTPKPQEKPDKNFTVAEISREIAAGNLSDKAVEKISQAIGKAVKEGTASPHVAAPAAIAFRQADASREKQQEFKEATEQALGVKTRIRKLFDRMTGISDEFTFLAEGNIPMEGGDEVWVEGIRRCAPQYLWNFQKMGIDLEKVLYIIKPKMEMITDESESKNGKKWQPAGDEIEILS